MKRLMYIPDLAFTVTLRVAAYHEESGITCAKFFKRTEMVISFLIPFPHLAESHPKDTLEIVKGFSSVISLSGT